MSRTPVQRATPTYAYEDKSFNTDRRMARCEDCGRLTGFCICGAFDEDELGVSGSPEETA